ncbi:amino acid/amide ABC transporter ATP-binding protein 2, HAAT family [Rhizobiales bacterium GAS191]|jgi:ABC-type branched-subunit amino acid transport system ATPase component|nr:amino acid/amide ABC transporter ATP-binding protein 2, HAAT family [Rhizobiales bacterium GAS191]
MTTASLPPRMAAPALEVSGLRSFYGEAEIIHGVDLSVQPGEILAVLGKNGMGKTTLLRTIMGYLRKASGSVRILGANVLGREAYSIAGLGVAYTPQDQALFPDISVADNLRLGLRSDKGFEAAFDRVSAIFPFLRERRRQKAGTLSGGEQKMLLMTRALMPRPQLMLIDEISEGLQPSIISRLSDVLKRQRDEDRTAILLIEQNIRFALGTADRYAVLKRGEIVDAGEAADAGAVASVTRHLSV